MGAYLSMAYLAKPVKEKESGDFDTEKLRCGYSTMQGWRTNQEDYYTVIKDFDKDSSFFAVFDGHGGHEVAKYCSENLAQFLKEHSAYKEGDIEKALIDGFLDFDELFVKPEIVDILKEWVQQRKEKDQNKKDKYLETMERKMLERLRNSKQKKDKRSEGETEEAGNADSACKELSEEKKGAKGTPKKETSSNEAAASSNSKNEDSEEEENIDSLFEEAHMPIEAVLEKYKGGKEASAKECTSDDAVASSSSSSGAACSSSSGSSSAKVPGSSSSKSSEAEAKPTNGETSGSNSGTCEADSVSSSCADSSSPSKAKGTDNNQEATIYSLVVSLKTNHLIERENIGQPSFKLHLQFCSQIIYTGSN
nr:unnamed protein product [Callosobruchus chinensis]